MMNTLHGKAVLDVRDLRLIVALAEAGSLVGASPRLHVTPSALSHQLGDIEDRLGVVLFERTWRKMVATPAGERLARAGGAILESIAQAEAAAREPDEGRFVLRISTECHTCYHWLPGVIRAYERVCPEVDVRIVAEATRAPIPELLAGNLDIAIVQQRVRDRRLEYAPVFCDELVALVSPAHPWAKRPSVAAKAFAHEHLIHYPLPRAELTIFQEVLVPAGVEPRRASPVQYTEAILEMVKGGLGVAVLARWAAAPHLASGAVRAVRIGRGLMRQWYAVRLRSASGAPLLRFIACVKEDGPAPNLRGPKRAP